MKSNLKDLPPHIINAINALLQHYGMSIQSMQETPEVLAKRYMTITEAENDTGLKRWTIAVFLVSSLGSRMQIPNRLRSLG